MIDTITLFKAFNYRSLAGNSKDMKRVGTSTYAYNMPKGSNLPKITINHDQRQYKDFLRAEVSVPKLLFGNNIESVGQTQIPMALKKISDYVSGIMGFDYDANSAKVSRVDYCYNFKLSAKDVPLYINAIKGASLSKMQRVIYGDGTVEFKNNSSRILLYDKYQETCHSYKKKKATKEDVERSIGILRLEVRYVRAGSCQRFAKERLSAKHFPAYLFTEKAAEYALSSALNRLGLASRVESIDNRYAKILNYCSIKESERLLGFLHLSDALGGIENTKQYYSPATFKRRVSDIEKALVNLNTCSNVYLPPLELNFESDLMAKAA